MNEFRSFHWCSDNACRRKALSLTRRSVRFHFIASTCRASEKQQFVRLLVIFALSAIWSSASALAVGPSPIPAGISIKIRTLDAIHSRQAEVGQSYRCTVAEAVVVDQKEIVSKGADCVLRVVETKEAGKLTGKSELQLELAQIRVGQDLVDVNSEVSTKESAGKGKGTGVKVGAGAAAGAILGGIFGGAKGAAIGAAAGAGAGAVTAAVTHGPEIKVASETLLTFLIK